MNEKIAAASDAIKTNIIFDLESAYVLQMRDSYKNVARGILERYTPYNKKFVMMLHTTGGHGKVITNTESFDCKAGDLLFVRYVDCPTMILEDGVWDAYLIWFFYENLDLPLSNQINIPILENEDKTIRKIISLVSKRDFNSTAQANGLALSFVAELLTNIDESSTNGCPKEIKGILEYINSSAEKKLTVEELAQELHVSSKHFRTLFERYVGMNPKQYIMKSKLERSQFYLTHTELSVQEIASKLSFSSPTHYINTFTKHYRITPLLYRKDSKNR